MWSRWNVSATSENTNTTFFFCLFRAIPMAYEVSRLGVKSELQLLAYTTATATRDLSCVYDLHHSSQQCWTLKPLNEARDRTCTLMVPGRIRYHWATIGTPKYNYFSKIALPLQETQNLRTSNFTSRYTPNRNAHIHAQETWTTKLTALHF